MAAISTKRAADKGGRVAIPGAALLWAAMAVAGVMVSAGCQQGAAIPPPPISPPPQPLKEQPASTQAVPPEFLAARVAQQVRELEAAGVRRGPAVPRIEEPVAPRVGETAPVAPVITVPPVEAAPAAGPAAGAAASTGITVTEVPDPRTAGTVPPPPAAPSHVQWPRETPPSVPAVPPQAPVVVAPVVPPAPPAVEAPVIPPVAMVPGPSANAAVPVTPGGDIESAVAERVARDPKDLSAALDGQLVKYLRGQSVPDAATLAALPAEDREVLSAVLDALVNFRSVVRADPNAMYSSKVRPLSDMTDRLRTRSELGVPVVTLCTAIRGFGLYEPAPAVISTRGGRAPLLYYEVVNFTSRLSDQRLWETRLQQQVTLYDANGRALWQDRPQSLTDLCRNKRSDFFVRYDLTLPVIAPGRYVLKVTVTDQNIGRVSEGVLPVEAK